MTSTTNALDQHLRGPWLAVLADRDGTVYPTFAEAAKALPDDAEMSISIVRGSARPYDNADGEGMTEVRTSVEHFASDIALETDAWLIDPEDAGCGAEARYAQAQHMVDGLNNVVEVDRLRAARTPHPAIWDAARDAMRRTRNLADDYETAGDVETAQRIRQALHIPDLHELLAAAEQTPTTEQVTA